MCSDFFSDTDDVVFHFKETAQRLDPELQQKYAGFICVLSTSVYEMAIKNILYQFCTRQNPLFGSFFQSKFNKINAKIQIEQIEKDFIDHFGKTYKDIFRNLLQLEEERILKSEGKSVKNSYNNIILWRHSFAHSGKILNTVTLLDVFDAYKTSKSVIYCLDNTLSI